MVAVKGVMVAVKGEMVGTAVARDATIVRVVTDVSAVFSSVLHEVWTGVGHNFDTLILQVCKSLLVFWAESPLSIGLGDKM